MNYGTVSVTAGVKTGLSRNPGQEVRRMNGWDDRWLVYPVLLLLCATLAAFTGPAAGLWSLLQVVAVIEATRWLGAARARRARG